MTKSVFLTAAEDMKAKWKQVNLITWNNSKEKHAS